MRSCRHKNVNTHLWKCCVLVLLRTSVCVFVCYLWTRTRDRCFHGRSIVVKVHMSACCCLTDISADWRRNVKQWCWEGRYISAIPVPRLTQKQSSVSKVNPPLNLNIFPWCQWFRNMRDINSFSIDIVDKIQNDLNVLKKNKKQFAWNFHRLLFFLKHILQTK